MIVIDTYPYARFSTMARVNTALQRARSLHDYDEPRMFLVLLEEVGEIAKAELEDAGRDAVESEILDAIAVLIRMLERR